MEKIKNYILIHPELFTILGLGIIFYVLFFYNIGAYPLMDTDETRYVSMARDMFKSRDFLTLYLNGEYFFEKPPLYFWNECLSFAIFGKINEFTASFPVSVCGVSICFLIYYMGKKTVSRLYGVISSLILATNLEFAMLSKFAILDIVVSACIAFSLCFGLMVYFCKENNKKYFWWLFYIFSGLAVMAKGIPGFVIPFGSMFIIAVLSKSFKQLFKPIYILPGITLFLLITLPWHILMFKIHNPLFWNEYVIKHHLSRFLGSEQLGRIQPFYFYLITLLWGFFPWILSCIFVWISKIKSFKSLLSLESTVNRFILFNTVIVTFTLLFFSVSETKLITYILPLYPFLACLGGWVWYNYLKDKKNEKLINIANYIIGGIFFIAAIAGMLTPFYLPKQLLTDISTAKVFCIGLTFISSIAIIAFTKRKLYYCTFAALVIFMSLISAVGTEKFYQIDYKFGQNDLMNFATFAKKRNVSLTTFHFGTKYSLIYYGSMPVIYGPKAGIDDLTQALKIDNNYVIIRNKELKNIQNKNFDIIKTGRKYSILEEKGKIK